MSSDDINVSTSGPSETPGVSGDRQYLMVFIGNLGSHALNTPVALDKDSFSAVLSQAAPAVAIALPDPLAGGQDWEFQVRFEKISDFDPEELLNQCSQGRTRLALRDKLLARQTGQASEADWQQACQVAAQTDPSLAWLLQTDAPPPQVQPPAGASILDMVDEPDDKVARDVAGLAEAAGNEESRISGSESGRLKAQLASLERECGVIADALLKHAEIRRLETVWRSLWLLVERSDFRAGVRLMLVHAEREHAVDQLIEQIIEPAFEGNLPTPSLLVFDYACGRTPVELEMLDYLAQHAQSLPTPVTVPLTADFFELKSLRLLKNLPNLSGLVDSWEYAKWRTLREQPYARSLAPVLGRFILRSPHEPKSKGLPFRETVAKIGDVLWCHGHIALALSAARAFARDGWPTRMYGANAGKLEDLPLVDNPNDPQNPWGPGDLLLPDARLDELPTVGINQLVAIKGSDHCLLLGGVSAAKPVVTQDIGMQQAALEISLPYQQVSSTISSRICALMPDLHGLAPEEIQQKLLAELSYLLGITGGDDLEAVQVGVGSDPNHPGQTIVQVRVIPPARVAPGDLPIEFGFAI